MKTITITLTVPDGVEVTVADGGPVAVQTAYVPSAPPQAVVAAPTAPHTCTHGARFHKAGTNKAGKPYEGWFCPEDQCSPEWVSAR